MHLGIISDTHGSFEKTVKILEFFEREGVEKIFHLGDVLNHGPRNDLPEGYAPKQLAEILKARNDIYYIQGNCDSEVDEMITGKVINKRERFFFTGHYGILMTHGHRESQEERLKYAAESGVKLILTGHTHIKILEKSKDFVFLNPGSPALPKDGIASFAMIEENKIFLLKENNFEILESLNI